MVDLKMLPSFEMHHIYIIYKKQLNLTPLIVVLAPHTGNERLMGNRVLGKTFYVVLFVLFVYIPPNLECVLSF